MSKIFEALQMIYEAQGQTIDLSKITRLYPAATVIAGGETAHVSLEWADIKENEVHISAFILVFDFDALGEEIKSRVELNYSTKEELIDAMKDVAQYLN